MVLKEENLIFMIIQMFTALCMHTVITSHHFHYLNTCLFFSLFSSLEPKALEISL